MFIVTARVRKGKLIAGVFAALLVIAGALALGGWLGSGGAVSAAAAVKGVKSNEDRIAYLATFGWEVESEPIAVEELLIPETLDESYDEYLALQKGQGFDLTEYQGRRVKRYTYLITNYPTGETGVQVSLLLYKNTVIGGDVLSPKVDGFIHGLKKPA